MNKDLILERIQNICNEKNITLNTAFVESGVGKNFKSNFKTANPSIGKITMLANYFGVSVDYLLGNTDEAKTESDKKPSSVIRNALSPREIALINAYRSHPELQVAVERILGIEQNGDVYVYTAAHSEDKRLNKIIRMDKETWEKIKNTPDTDDTLL